MHALLSFAAEGALSVLAPPRCAACDARIRLLSTFCSPCAQTVARLTSNGAGTLVAPFVYGGAVARAIVRMKYERRPDLARPLADLLWRQMEPMAQALRGAIVVPVPLHPSRLAERGFNQAALIGNRISRRLGAQFRPLALRRIRQTLPQATLDQTARDSNVADAFVAREPRRVIGRHVVLVDDVTTTGATLNACTRALFGVGAAAVTRAVVASTEQHFARHGV